MKKEFSTKKLYYGFPIVIIGYKDDKWKYNVTTNSSSYSLGNIFSLGLVAESNCAKHIKKYRQFTVNMLYKNQLSEIEMCGYYSGINKLGMADLTYDPAKYIDAPILDDAYLSLECEVKDFVECDGYINIVATIKNRWIEETLLENDKLKCADMEPVFFLGDENKRIYRYLSEEVNNLGDFLESEESECSE